METLLDDYKRKLANINKMTNDLVDERLLAKKYEYKSFIVDIERAIERNQIANKVCMAGKSYGDCHMHNDNEFGCLDCGNFQKIED